MPRESCLTPSDATRARGGASDPFIPRRARRGQTASKHRAMGRAPQIFGNPPKVPGVADVEGCGDPLYALRCRDSFHHSIRCSVVSPQNSFRPLKGWSVWRRACRAWTSSSTSSGESQRKLDFRTLRGCSTRPAGSWSAGAGAAPPLFRKTNQSTLDSQCRPGKEGQSHEPISRGSLSTWTSNRKEEASRDFGRAWLSPDCYSLRSESRNGRFTSLSRP